MSPSILEWSAAPWHPVLIDNEVHIWCVSLEQEQARVEAFFRTLSQTDRSARSVFALRAGPTSFHRGARRPATF